MSYEFLTTESGASTSEVTEALKKKRRLDYLEKHSFEQIIKRPMSSQREKYLQTKLGIDNCISYKMLKEAECDLDLQLRESALGITLSDFDEHLTEYVEWWQLSQDADKERKAFEEQNNVSEMDEEIEVLREYVEQPHVAAILASAEKLRVYNQEVSSEAAKNILWVFVLLTFGVVLFSISNQQ